MLVVVDQLPTWQFEHDRPHFTGGFARMLREGAIVPAGQIPYASPFTAVGHAAIGTGTVPAVHGVFGNSWYRRTEAREVPAESDPDANVLVVGPSLGGELGADDHASGRALRIEGLADTLRSVTGGKAHSAAVSLKARGAVFTIGKRPDIAIWYEAAAGGMTTSTAYAAETPAWLAEHARTHPVSRFFSQTWDAKNRDLLGAITGDLDVTAGEGSVHGFTPAFPHSLAASDAPERAILHTPFGDQLVADAALAAIDALALGQDDVPDLLAVSFSAHDYAGHLWGPSSWEAVELLMALDGTLASFFTELDRRFGKDGWAAVLTSDHGATPIVERSFTIGSRRIRSAEISSRVDEAFMEVAQLPAATAKVVASSVYLSPEARALPNDVYGSALTLAITKLRMLDGIATAGRSDAIRGNCDVRAGLDQAICLSIVDGEAGELYVMPVAGSLISDYKTGTHHDAPFDDNRLVPIIVRAAGVSRQVGQGNLLQVAPTVAALLGIPPPPASTEQPLFGITIRTRR